MRLAGDLRAGELLVQRVGVRMTHIPYKGSAPATIDLIAGQAQVFFATVPTILAMSNLHQRRRDWTVGQQ